MFASEYMRSKQIYTALSYEYGDIEGWNYYTMGNLLSALIVASGNEVDDVFDAICN